MTDKPVVAEKLTLREQASIRVLFFMLQMLNPTGYEHQVKRLRDEMLALLEGGE